jgi:hypothetical protein
MTTTSELIDAVAALTGDDGTGDLGVIVRQALRDDPAAAAWEIAEIVREARADASGEHTCACGAPYIDINRSAPCEFCGRYGEAR